MKHILQGIVIGLANVIPGVSGGTMAVSMGIYDKLIHSVTHLFKEFKKSVKFLFPVGIGMVLAVIGLSFIIEIAFEKFPLPTNSLFIGLIIGGMPAIVKKIGKNPIKAGHIISCAIFFLIVAGMSALGDANGAEADLSYSLINIIKLFLVGLVASATMVIPGVSGSMMLLLLGYYNPIIATINAFVKALIAFNIPELLRCMGILLPFGIGIIVGIFAIAKVIEIIFEKFPLYAYWAIIGLIAASPIAILMVSNLGVFSIGAAVAAVVTFVIGFIVAMKLGD